MHDNNKSGTRIQAIAYANWPHLWMFERAIRTSNPNETVIATPLSRTFDARGVGLLMQGTQDIT